MKDKVKDLYTAIRNDDLETVLELIKKGVELNSPDKISWTPLHAAVLLGRDNIINHLIKAGADLNALDFIGDTPLHKAAKKESSEIFELLINAGADSNIKNKDEKLAIDYAPNFSACMLPDSSAEVSKQDFHYIVGPGINDKSINLPETTIIHGDGTNQVDIKELSITKGSRVIISAHGNHDGDRHQISLYSSLGHNSGLDYTFYNFQAIAKASKKMPVNIELFSCKSGIAINDIVYLPKDSTLMTFVGNRYTIIGEGTPELLSESIKFPSPENPFIRYASYLATNADDNYFAISTSVNSIFKSRISKLNDFSDNGIKTWQKDRIKDFSKFLDKIKDYTDVNNKERIEKFQEIVSNDSLLNSFIDSFDTKRYKERYLLNMISSKRVYAAQTFLNNYYELDINHELYESIGNSLHFAVQRGLEQVVQSLLYYPKIDINKGRNTEGATALMIAAQLGYKEIIQLLIEDSRIEVNKGNDDDYTALFAAAQVGQEESVQLLLTHKDIDVNKNEKTEGLTPLIIAINKGHNNIVRALLKNKDIDVNKAKQNGVTPLHMAVGLGQKEIVQLLLAHKNIDINEKLYDGSSLLDMAVVLKKQKVIKMLMKAGVRYNKKTTAIMPEYFSDQAIFRLFKEAIDDNDTKSIENLLKYHSSFKDKFIENTQDTLLTYARSKNKQEIVNYMRELDFKDDRPSKEQPRMLDDIAQTMKKANDFLKLHDPLRIPVGVEATKNIEAPMNIAQHDHNPTYSLSINESPADVKASDIATNGINMPSIHVRDIAENAYSQIALTRVMAHIIGKAAESFYSFVNKESAANYAPASHEAKDMDKKLLSLEKQFGALYNKRAAEYTTSPSKALLKEINNLKTLQNKAALTLQRLENFAKIDKHGNKEDLQHEATKIWKSYKKLKKAKEEINIKNLSTVRKAVEGLKSVRIETKKASKGGYNLKKTDRTQRSI